MAFTARSPYLLVECCPGPITSNAAAIPQFQWRPQRNCFLPWDFPASLPKHRVIMAEGINLRSGGNWFAAIPICSLLLRLGSRFTPIDLCMALNRLHGFNFGGLCNERYPKIVSYLIVLRIPEKLCGFGYQSRNSVDGLFNDKCKTLTSSMVDGCINVATIQNWE